MNEQQYVEDLYEKNSKDYKHEHIEALFNTLLPRAFPCPWLYLFEITQNALDANAKKIRINTTKDSLTFEHDGDPFTERNIRAISRLADSTKGFDTVGFMGVGFKSVFQRFYSAEVFSGPWKLKFFVETETDSLDNSFPRWLDTVLPKWNSVRFEFDKPYTTCFSLSSIQNHSDSLRADLAHFVDQNRPNTLAILAPKGLKELVLNDRTYQVEYSSGQNSVTVLEQSSGESWKWLAFSSDYTPSRPAVKDFAQFRRKRLRDDSEVHELEKPRRAFLFVPASEDFVPQPLKRGIVYATLPTNVEFCFGGIWQADWFVDITRRGLRDFNTPWQLEIISQFPDLLKSYLTWLVETSKHRKDMKQGLALLRVPEDQSPLDSVISRDDFVEKLKGTLNALAFVPAHTHDEAAVNPSEVKRLPACFNALSRKAALPHRLFSCSIIDFDGINPGFREFLEWLGYGEEIDLSHLRQVWPKALDVWWKAFEGKEEPTDTEAHEKRLKARSEAYIALLLGVKRRANNMLWLSLPIFQTRTGSWVPIYCVKGIKGSLPSPDEFGGDTLWQYLEPNLPPREETLSESAQRAIYENSPNLSIQSNQKGVQDWLDHDSKQKSLEDFIKETSQQFLGASDNEIKYFVCLAIWARNRQASSVVSHLVVESKEGVNLSEPSSALIATPYVEDGESREAVFPTLPKISSLYLENGRASPEDWRKFFQQLDAKGRLEFVDCSGDPIKQNETFKLGKLLGVPPNDIRRCNSKGYTLVDQDFVNGIELSSNNISFANWLTTFSKSIPKTGKLSAEGSYHRRRIKINGTTYQKWLQRLEAEAWVPTKEKQFLRPCDVLPIEDPDYENAPVAAVSMSLIQSLRQAGLRFGNAVSKSPAIRRLTVRKPERTEHEFFEILEEALEVAKENEFERESLRKALRVTSLPSGKTIDRLVGGNARSLLNGFVQAISELDPKVALKITESVTFCNLPKVPKATTGRQALRFIEEIWQNNQSVESTTTVDSDSRLLGLAYKYVLEDVEDDAQLQEKWDELKGQARVYTTRDGWVEISDQIAFDDLCDRRLRKFVKNRFCLVTPRQFGDSIEQQIKVVRELGVKSIREELCPTPFFEGHHTPQTWRQHFHQLCLLLEIPEEMVLEAYDSFGIIIEGERIPFSARVETPARLCVSGTPVDFAAEATEELVRSFSLDLEFSPHLALLLISLDKEQQFQKVLRSFASKFNKEELLNSLIQLSSQEQGESSSNRSTSRSIFTREGSGSHPGNVSDRSESRDFSTNTGASGQSSSEREWSTSPGQQAPDQRRIFSQVSVSPERSSSISVATDALYREAVVEYERLNNRSATVMPSNQPGFDIQSFESDGSTRRIEVKGVQGNWIEESCVYLTSTQFEAGRTGKIETIEYWLYVVERATDEGFNILTIPWTRQEIGRYFFYASDWRDHAVENRYISLNRPDIQAEEFKNHDSPDESACVKLNSEFAELCSSPEEYKLVLALQERKTLPQFDPNISCAIDPTPLILWPGVAVLVESSVETRRLRQVGDWKLLEIPPAEIREEVESCIDWIATYIVEDE